MKGKAFELGWMRNSFLLPFLLKRIFAVNSPY